MIWVNENEHFCKPFDFIKTLKYSSRIRFCIGKQSFTKPRFITLTKTGKGKNVFPEFETLSETGIESPTIGGGSVSGRQEQT